MATGRKTGGRKPGSKNKRTTKLEQAAAGVAEIVAKALGIDAFEGDAHAFLMLIYKNQKMPVELRIDAAKAAVRYEKPALASHEVKNETTVRYVARVPNKVETSIGWQQQHAPETKLIQ
jgi:hypothetical protein